MEGEFMKVLMWFLVVISIVPANAQTENAEKSQIDGLKLAQNIYLLRSNARIGNPNSVALIGKEGVFLVDASFSLFSKKLSASLGGFGGTKIKYIVNTHWHGDHTAGNENFGGSATILARSNVRKRLLSQGILEDNGRLIKKIGLPAISYESPLTIYLNDEEIRIMVDIIIKINVNFLC